MAISRFGGPIPDIAQSNVYEGLGLESPILGRILVH
jgi:hypothetical protein